MKKKLIVNADDFGYTRGVNAGIIRAFQEGIVTSTTLMANGAAFEDAVKQAREHSGLRVGCHLVLVGGERAVAPSKEVASLVDGAGRLPESLPALVGKLIFGSLWRAVIEREFRAQIEKVMKAGIVPTHLDSHKHTHLLPRVMEAMARVGVEFGIRRIRKPFEDFKSLWGLAPSDGSSLLKQRLMAMAAHAVEPDFRRLARSYGLVMPGHFFGAAVTGRLTCHVVRHVIDELPEGTSELMCHPGECDAELESSRTRLRRERENELHSLIDPEVRLAIDRRGVQLVDYRALD